MNYLIAFPAEIQAQQLLEPYGYAVILPRPAGQSWDDYAWNNNGIEGGTKIILSYDGQGRPVYDTQWFWASVVNANPDDALWNRFSGQPMIEFDMDRPPSVPPKASAYVTRSVHLAFNIDAIKGITPIWYGQKLIFPYKS